MTAREMHYDFKQKLNKIDSQRYRNLLVPEIDWKLNEAQEVFVKVIAEPRLKNGFGFEINQRTIDDIRTLVVNQTPATGLAATTFDDESYVVTLPNEYWFHISSYIIASKGDCSNVKMRTIERQHDDRFQESPFDISSFEWREANIRFFGNEIRIFTDKTFTVSKLCIDYIKRPRMIYNASDYPGETYNTLSGITLSGTQDCELPEATHREIVDMAVLITTGDLQIPDYQIKQNKLNLTK